MFYGILRAGKCNKQTRRTKTISASIVFIVPVVHESILSIYKPACLVYYVVIPLYFSLLRLFVESTLHPLTFVAKDGKCNVFLNSRANVSNAFFYLLYRYCDVHLFAVWWCVNFGISICNVINYQSIHLLNLSYRILNRKFKSYYFKQKYFWMYIQAVHQVRYIIYYWKR